MIERYIECATVAELDERDRALLEAHEADLRARLKLPLGESLDRNADGTPAPRTTRRYAAPIVDANGRALLPLDARAMELSGRKVTADGREYVVDLAAAKPAHALSQAWRDVLEGKRRAVEAALAPAPTTPATTPAPQPATPSEPVPAPATGPNDPTPPSRRR